VAGTIVEHFAPAFVIVDESGQALYFSAGTGKYLQAAAGPPNRDIVAMARQGLRADLRALLHQAKQEGRRVARDRLVVQVNGGVQTISLAVEPITEGNETAYGVVFIDRGPIETEHESANSETLETQDITVQQIERELNETKERLESTIEELETANEEFRSSNEELVSVNEELQSANEELETSKEELQSVNEELQTVNNELTSKIDELDRANSDLTNLFQSTQIATVFLDRDLVIRSFTPEVTKLFSLIPSDRGRPLTDIASRIDYPDLQNDIRTVFAGESIERPVEPRQRARPLSRTHLALSYREGDRWCAPDLCRCDQHRRCRRAPESANGRAQPPCQEQSRRGFIDCRADFAGRRGQG